MRIQAITCLLLLSIVNFASADRRQPDMVFPLPPEKSVEAVEFKISNTTGNGYILAKDCLTCANVRLNVTAKTQAFYHNRPVPMSQVPATYTKNITVIYEPSTLNAKRIYW